MQLPPKILILGGGPAGMALARDLVGVAVEVTMVDEKSFYEVNYATPRVLVDEKQLERVGFEYEDAPLLKPTKFITGRVDSVAASDVLLSSGERLTFDYLAICTGSTYSNAFNKPAGGASLAERRRDLKRQAEELRAAASVLIVGGGPSGVEMAGEIVTAYPQKRVTLVSATQSLIPSQKPSVGRTALKFLMSKGAQVILGDKVTRTQSGQYRLAAGGEDLPQPDLVFWCTGQRPNTAFLRNTMPDILDASGYIKVNPSLQVEGHANIFALGDCNNVPEAKMAFRAGLHGELVAGHIKALVKRPAAGATKLKQWRAGAPLNVMFVTLGSRYGVGQIGPLVERGFVPTQIKSKDMLIGKARAQFGLK